MGGNDRNVFGFIKDHPDAQRIENDVNQDFTDAYSKVRYAFEAKDGFRGAVFLISGVLLTFFGKKIFKPALSLVSAAVGWGVAHVLLQSIDRAIGGFGEKSAWIYGIVCFLSALLLSAIVWKLFKLGVLILGGLAGYMLTSLGLSFINASHPLSQSTNAIVVVAGGAAGAIIAAAMEETIVELCTAIVGSCAIFAGVDAFWSTGFTERLNAILVLKDFPDVSKDPKAIILAGGTIVLAIVGFVFQSKFFSSSSRKKGHV